MEEKGYVSLHAGLFSSKCGLVGLDALTATDYVGGKVIIRGVKVLEVKGCVIKFWLIPLLFHSMRVGHHIIVAVDGIYDNVIKFKPPMCFSLENAEHFISSLETVLSNTSC